MNGLSTLEEELDLEPAHLKVVSGVGFMGFDYIA